VSTTETAILCEIGPEPEPGRLRCVSIALYHKDPPVTLTVATLEEACAVARARGWTLVPLPADSDYQPTYSRDLSDEAWALVTRLMAK